MRETLVVLVAIFLCATVYVAASNAGIAEEARVLRATLAELEASNHPESHPYFWFCPSAEECEVDGYVTWYASHGGRP